ncbi:MAG: hypothetical protein IT521_09795 [Burkholderiales bacterium]|nr:hypothetical protein [Burkholderiales bacterium]
MANVARSILFSVIGIVISGTAGGVAGWSVVTTLGWSGVAGAVVAAGIGMVVATFVWVAITLTLRKVGMLR